MTGSRSAGRRILAQAAALLLALAIVPATAAADEDVWAFLEGGGQVILMRHALTTPGFGDPPGMRLDDCATQRNLTEEGRRHARRAGEAFRARSIAVERVLSSPWCRCVETAQLAFGRAEVSQALGNLYGRPEAREEQVRAMKALVDGWRGRGNLVLVSHGSTILALTGIHPGSGEMVVVTPREGGGFTVRGRLSAHSP
jgi:broad specificity phosphatase PhoE